MIAKQTGGGTVQVLYKYCTSSALQEMDRKWVKETKETCCKVQIIVCALPFGQAPWFSEAG